jgi:hypothetical protein
VSGVNSSFLTTQLECSQSAKAYAKPTVESVSARIEPSVALKVLRSGATIYNWLGFGKRA